MVNALLSGDTVAAAVPSGQPDPFAETTSMVMLSCGSGGRGAGGVVDALAVMAVATPASEVNSATEARTTLRLLRMTMTLFRR
ncbi:hypothetical protein Adu01nite_62210 [Paractinoplanes durhamensis]|uniref:Uncharacterized protein n=1 Tax=Paractinoplanes durhamensis TaxID=113563 RepID=A0ABQ3Z4Z0_9ACTN|nr:hypothetical protein Adu01nite_62210 [Actinoplanes durhamensis]